MKLEQNEVVYEMRLLIDSIKSKMIS